MSGHTENAARESPPRSAINSGPRSTPVNGFVTHGELLQLAQRQHCQGIYTEPVESLCKPDKNF